MKHRAAVRIAILAGTLVKIGAHRMLPGVAGAALVSAGGGQIAGHVFGRGVAPWVAITLAGVFVLLAAAETNRR